MTDLLQRIANLEETVRRLSIRAQHTIKSGRQVEPSVETGVVQGIRLKHNSRDTRDVTSMQTYGFASATPIGTDLVTVQMSGDSSNGFCIASNHQVYRPINLSNGETCIYDDSGQQVYLSKQGGVLSINVIGGAKVNITASVSVNVTAPTVFTSGDVISGTGAAAVSLRSHTHKNITVGTGNSGVPNGGP